MTPPKVKRLIEALKVGASRESACQYAGIGWTTLKRWLAEGRRDRAEGVESDCHTLLVDVEDAEASCIVGSLGIIIRAAQGGDWKAAAWLLERRRPLQYAKGPKRLEHEAAKEAQERAEQANASAANVDQALESVLSMLSDEAAQELLEALQRRRESEASK